MPEYSVHLICEDIGSLRLPRDTRELLLVVKPEMPVSQNAC